MKTRCLAFLFLIASSMPLNGIAAAPADDPAFVLVAHPGVPEDEVTEVTMRRIYLGKKTRWDGDLRITPVMRKGGDLHEAFVKKVLNRTVASFETYWKQAVFTGRGIPPRSFETEEELVFYVSQTPGALGYVSEDAPRPGVKILSLE